MNPQLVVKVAQVLLNRQPPAIRSRLQESETLQAIGLKTYSGVEIAGTSFLLPQLFAAARKVGPGESQETVKGVHGSTAILSRSREGIVLSTQSGEQLLKVRLPALALLSSEREERLRVFGEVVDTLGPTSSISGMRPVVADRPFTDEEIQLVIEEQSDGVAGLQSRLAEKLRKSEAMFKDLVPASLGYFEKFCGPNPGSVGPDEYFASVLPAYRKELLHRDLRGIGICLLGSLRDDLYPASWLKEVDTDLLFTTLVDCQPERDPVSLLGALDLALSLHSDTRFRSFAENAFSLLTQDQFQRADGGNTYLLIPALARFVLNQINIMEGGTLRPPYWKRMCAWMQATLVARLTADIGIDFEIFSGALINALEAAGEHANALDLRQEPLIEAIPTARLALRRQIVGRLGSLSRRHPEASAILPLTQEIQRIHGQLQKKAPFCWLLPGPLEGSRRRGVLPDETRASLAEHPGNVLIAFVASLSQVVGLDDDTKELLRTKAAEELKQSDLMLRLDVLLHLTTVIAAERDTTLTQMVAEGVLTLAPQLDEKTIGAAVEILLRAAAAFEDESAWAEWLERQFLCLASRVPAGEPARALRYHIRELKRVTRLELGIFGRAEGAAIAAAPWE